MGNGANIDMIRSDKFIWAYELTYVYLLFSTGIAGVLFYFSWFLWGLIRIKKELKNTSKVTSYIAPIVTGIFGIALASASNPYFTKFDYLWIIMLPHLIAGGLRYQKVEHKE